MPFDDAGNQRIDFVWGNMPLQPNYVGGEEGDRSGIFAYPGDGFAEAFLKGLVVGNGVVPSTYLDAKDNHVTALRQYKDFPAYDPESDFTLTVDWWAPNIPAFQYPNIAGVDVEDAKKQLIECGVDPLTLVDLEFDTEDPELRYVGYSEEEGYLNTVNAPGADNPGIIVYRYFEPGTVIGQHADGSDWLAEESENKVLYTTSYIGEPVAVPPFVPESFSWWHSFVVLQTKDPFKNSYLWWLD